MAQYAIEEGARVLPARKLLVKRSGKRIADQRKSIDWTQHQLAEGLGVNAVTASRFERGVTVPSLVTPD